MEYPIFTKYETKIARQYSDYSEIKGELEKIKIFSAYYSQKYSQEIFLKGSNPDRVCENSDLIPMESIFVTIIMMYAKCFDESSNRRKIKLSKDFLKGADEEIKNNHEYLMEIRNKFLAHADDTELENYDVLIGIHENGNIAIKLSPDNYKVMTGEAVEEKNIIPLIDEILKRVEKKIVKLSENMDEEIKSLCLNNQGFVNKIKNRIPISDTDSDFARKQGLSKIGF
jgi:hypothetical protein